MSVGYLGSRWHRRTSLQVNSHAEHLVLDINLATRIGATHPLPEQLYTIQDSQASLLLSHPVFAERAEQLKEHISCHILDDDTLESFFGKDIPVTFDFDMQRSAMILYTSGTTGIKDMVEDIPTRIPVAQID